MRRSLITIAVLLGALLGGFTVAPASAATLPADADVIRAAAISNHSPTEAGDAPGCKDPNNWWDNLRLNGGSMPYCDTDLDWPWLAGDAQCTVISNGVGVPELVNCSGTTPATNGPIACYINVFTRTTGSAPNGKTTMPVESNTTTVCTSSKDQTHRDTLNANMAKGGKKGELMFGCAGGDGMCMAVENWSRAMASDTVGTLVGVVSTSGFTVEGPLWDAAAGEWSYWVWAVLGIMLIATVWAITAAIYSKDRADMVTAVVRTFVGFPMIIVTYWMGSHLIGTFDEWTLYTLSRGESIAEVFRRFSQILYAGGEGDYFMNFLIVATSWVGSKIMNIIFALRTLGLAVLMMAGPVAWMMFSVKNIGPQWVVRWGSAFGTLLLAGPLTMGFLMLIFRGIGNLDVLWSPDAWPLLLGLVLTVFAPFAVMSLFSFAGAAAADSLGGAVGHAGRAGWNAARSGTRSASNMIQKWAPAGRSGANRPSGMLPNGQRGGTRTAPAGRSDTSGPTHGKDGRPGQSGTPAPTPAGRDTSPASPGGGPAPAPAGKK